jgi:Transposase and inactivated derivatives
MPKNYTEEFRAQIIGMWRAGRAVRDIAREMGCTVRTVNRWITRFEEEGEEVFRDHRRNSRRKKTTAEEDAVLVNTVVAEPFRSVNSVLNELDLNISNRTARRRLNDQNIYCRRPARTPLLLPQHLEARMNFARRHLAVPADVWSTTIFTDEKVIIILFLLLLFNLTGFICSFQQNTYEKSFLFKYATVDSNFIQILIIIFKIKIHYHTIME